MTTSRTRPRFLLTAEEAYPAFEELVLDARDRVVMGFRVFDPATKLRSDAARAIGQDWSDLLIHVLQKGIRVDLTLSDFDAIGSPEMHSQTWSSLRKIAGIVEIAGDAGRNFQARAALHPSRIGWVSGLALWPRVHSELREVRDWLNTLAPIERAARMRDLPGLWRWLELRDDGTLEQIGRGPFPLHPVSHHQKLAVIDGETLYIGGLDLNPRRYDTKRHHRPGEETWHDVQMIAQGPAVARAEAHLRAFREATHLDADPPEEGDGFLLTLSVKRPRQKMAFGPKPVRHGLNDLLIDRIASARRFIYFETQFFRDRQVARALARAAGDNPDLQVLFVLPAAPEDVAFEGRTKADARYGEHLQASCLKIVTRAFGDRIFFTSPVQPRSAGPGRSGARDRFGGAPLIYVHAKMAVFDRASVLISSANMNGRSLHWDTEAGLFTDDADFAREAQDRSLSHWAHKRTFDPDAPVLPQVHAWTSEDVVRQPENREGFLLPYDVAPARRFGMPLPGVPAEMV